MWQGITDLELLLEPQERLDRLITTTWRRFGPKVVDLSYANPYDGPDQEVLGALQRAVSGKRALAFQYTPYGGSTVTRRLIASTLSREYGFPFDLRDVIMTPGAMSALNVACRTLFGSEDQVLVLTPCWQDYPLYLRNLHIPMSFVGLREDKHLDLDAISGAVGGNTKGVLFSHPCCPTGVLYAKEEIDGLCELLRAKEERLGIRIYLISDEVHRQMIWGGQAFYSPLVRYPRSLSIYSFGKALSLQGQRIGYVAVSPRMPEHEEVRRMLKRWVRIMGFCTPTSLMQRAICDLLDYTPPLPALAQKQAMVRTALAAYGYDLCEADATFFVYVKSPIRDEFKFAELLAAYGVLVVPSILFHEPGFVRLSLTARAESIAAGLPVFARVLKEL